MKFSIVPNGFGNYPVYGFSNSTFEELSQSEDTSIQNISLSLEQKIDKEVDHPSHTPR